MPSPMFLTVDEHSQKCQLPLLDNLEPSKAYKSQEVLDGKALTLILQSLDLIDLLILEAVTISDGLRTRQIALSVHLSNKATLAHSRRLTELKLLICQTVDVRGGIKPANLFFPAPGLTLKAIQDAIETARANQAIPGRKQDMEDYQSDSHRLDIDLASLDVLSLLILGLIGREEANTTKSIQERLQLKSTPVQNRLRELRQANLVTWMEKHPFPHRPGLKERYYSLADSISLSQVQAAISQINPANLPALISLEVFWHNSGLAQATNAQNGNGNSSSNRSVFVSSQVSTDSSISSSSLPQSSVEKMDKIFQLLRAMAEKLAEYEDRFTRIEEKLEEQSNASLQDVDAILAIIPPRKC